jgi:transaldolase
MKPIHELSVKIFADGADIDGMLEMSAIPYIKGFTTNPTLMRKAGVADYCEFAQSVLKVITDRPISFEVFSDDFAEMERQAHIIASWGENVYVKIPVMNTQRQPSFDLVRRLAKAGIKQNITALMTLDQVCDAVDALQDSPPSVISVFAGRIADTGRDPIPVMTKAAEILSPYPQLELLWASPRELLNIYHADHAGCHIITVTNEVLKKLYRVGQDLDDLSHETVDMFYSDAQKSNFHI